MKSIYLMTLAVLLTLAASAQDRIYKRDGTMCAGKVKTVAALYITYTHYGDDDGPTDTLRKSMITRIVYENGTADFFKPTRGAKGAGGRYKGRQPADGNNIITIIPAAYTAEPLHKSMNDAGAGLCYERITGKGGHFGLVLPLVYSFTSERDFSSEYFYVTPLARTSGYHSLMAAPGVKYYPDRSSNAVRYALGGNMYIISGKEPYSMYDTRYQNGYPVAGDRQYTVLGLMMTNSVNVSLGRRFYMEASLNVTQVMYDDRRINNDIFETALSMILQGYIKAGIRL